MEGQYNGTITVSFIDLPGNCSIMFIFLGVSSIVFREQITDYIQNNDIGLVGLGK